MRLAASTAQQREGTDVDTESNHYGQYFGRRDGLNR